MMTQSNFQMVDITQKAPTPRKAEATGSIEMSREAFLRVRDRSLPKGDALILAEMAGIQGAKHTSTLLPLCHPIPIEEVTVKCELDEANSAVRVTCRASTTAKTGVEMEALVGANIALLCLYDLIKPVEPALTLREVRLNFKSGGKHGHWVHPDAPSAAQRPALSTDAAALKDIPCGVVTVSDRVSRGLAEDRSGPAAREWLAVQGAGEVESRVVPDEKEAIQEAVGQLVAMGCQLIFTSGGTGLGPRDVTIPSLQEIAAKEMRGVGELLRAEGASGKRAAWLSNSSCFVVKKSLVISLPGSATAVAEGLRTLRDLLPHALHILKGGGHG